jgi:S1-C subfamily serine protease
MISFTCPRCKKLLEEPEDKAGSKFPCPGCGQRLQVPDVPYEKTMPGNLIQVLAAQRAQAPPAPRPAPQPAPEPANWYYQQGRQQAGPVTWGQLQQLAAQGRIRPQDAVWSKGMPNWVPSGSVGGLFSNGQMPRADYGNGPQGPAGYPPSRARSGVLLTVVCVLLGLVLLAGAGGIGWYMIDRAKDKVNTAKDKDAEAEKAAAPANLTSQQIVEKYARSVARVALRSGGGGTGFLVRPGVVATNAHVVDAAPFDQFVVYFPSAGDAGKVGKPPKHLLYKDGKRDLALFSVDSDLPPLPIAERYKFQSGQTITVIGSPGSGLGHTLENTVAGGILGTQTEAWGLPWYQLTAPLNPGNSGGPVFDTTGQVIAVVSFRPKEESGVHGIAYGVPVADVLSAVQRVQDAPKDSAEKTTSRHNLEVVFRGVARAGICYSNALDICAAVRVEADRAGKDPNVELRKHWQQNEKLINNKQLGDRLLAPVRASVKTVTSDEQLPESTREKMRELWAVFTEMKDYVDRPRGTPQAYANKSVVLWEQYKKLIESLRLMIGLDEKLN